MWETEASPKASGSLLRQMRPSSSNRHVVDADNRWGYTQGKEAYPRESNRVSHRADQLREKWNVDKLQTRADPNGAF